MKYSQQDLLGKIIDIHTHSTGIALYRIISGKYPVTQDLVDLSENASRENVDYVVTFPMPTTIYYAAEPARHEGVFIPTGLEEYPYQYENQSLVKLVHDLHLTNVLPFLSISLHSCVDEQLLSISNLAREYPVYGLKYHGTMEHQSILCREFERFAALAETLNIPIMLHSEISPVAHPMDAVEFARKHPCIRICVAHAGRMYQPFFDVMQTESIHNLYVDTAPLNRICYEHSRSAIPMSMALDFSVPTNVLKSLHNIMPDNLLWGTDMPWHRYMHDNGCLSTYSEEVATLLQSGLAQAISRNTTRFLFGDE